MEYRRFGRAQWQVSEIGYGMWGLASWSGTDTDEVQKSLDRAIELGCNFFDTAWAYGEGKSEQILGSLVRRNTGKTLYVATKIPPKNRQWPSTTGMALKDVFPEDYIREYTERSLSNLGLGSIDLMQFHVWEDEWAKQDEWKKTIEALTKEGKVRRWGISVNRWEPDNCLRTLGTGLIDAVQVIYNIFEQAPEDKLFPLCRELDIAVIARVPLDEGTLSGTLTKETVFPKEDWRSTYFVPENLNASVDKAEALRPLIPRNSTMAETALRFILENREVSTIIPGMRKIAHVESNIGTSDGVRLPADLMKNLKGHRWDRTATEWSQ